MIGTLITVVVVDPQKKLVVEVWQVDKELFQVTRQVEMLDDNNVPVYFKCPSDKWGIVKIEKRAGAFDNWRGIEFADDSSAKGLPDYLMPATASFLSRRVG